MRKISLTLIIIHFSLIIGKCQWINQNSSDSIKYINSCNFIDANTGWLSGMKGRISKTTSGGLSWQTKIIDYSTNFYSVRFINSASGFICGNNGKIYKTVNGGDNWFLLTTSNTDTLYSLDFVDVNTGWCVGYHIILKTTNQGANWSVQNFNIPVISLQRAVIKMYDSQNGLIGGMPLGTSNGDSYIFKTTNGGNNWNYVESFGGYYVTSIVYLSSQNVFLTNYQAVYKSINGGSNWALNFGLGSVGFSYLKFSDINTGWTAHQDYLYKTTNGGNNWILNNMPYMGLGIIGLDCFSSNIIYVVQIYGSVYKSTNGGISWGNFSCDSHNYLNSIRAFDENTCIISGENGTIVKTTDGGLSWHQKYRDILDYFGTIYFINNYTGWAIGQNKSLIKTTNEGENWTLNYKIFPKTPYNLFCINENNYWVIGDSGMVLKTTNNGVTWLNLSPDSTKRYFWLKVSGNNVLLGSDSLYRSTNGGNNWYIVTLDSLHYPYSLFFLNDQTGWIFEPSQNFYKTTNGGVNWNICHYNNLQEIVGRVNFVNENTGYAATFSYDILKTTDGGYNWVTQVNQLSDYTSNVSFINLYTGWVCGNRGLIYKTTNGGSTYINVGNINTINKFFLFQNYPNPFNPYTKIKFEIPPFYPPLGKGGNGGVSLKIFDILGKEIQTLVNEQLSPGTYEVTFDGSNLPSGIYFYQLRSGEYLETKKLVLLK